MADTSPGDVTLGEIDRRLRDMRDDFNVKLADVTSEIRSLRSELVRRDVYDANRITDGQRIHIIEAKVESIEDERRTMRRLVYGAFFSATGGLAVTIGAYVLGIHH